MWYAIIEVIKMKNIMKTVRMSEEMMENINAIMWPSGSEAVLRGKVGLGDL